jgi:hypothetical protein
MEREKMKETDKKEKKDELTDTSDAGHIELEEADLDRVSGGFKIDESTFKIKI